MATVGVADVTRFQLASTALTVTLTGAPAVTPVGVPVLPVTVPGAAVSPGSSTWSFVAGPGRLGQDREIVQRAIRRGDGLVARGPRRGDRRGIRAVARCPVTRPMVTSPDVAMVTVSPATGLP